MTLSRRAALQLLGAAALPSLARADGVAAGVVSGWTELAHARAASAPPDFFRADERALISALADAILPRTDTLGALDVGVPAFVEVIAADWMTEVERSEFSSGLAAIELHALGKYGRAWPALNPAERESEMTFLEDISDPGLPARRGYRRLRGYVLHGYLTSERVQREILKVDITPGRYFGCTPMPAPDDLEGAPDV